MNRFLMEEQLKVLIAKEEERLHVGNKVFRERHDEIMRTAENLMLLSEDRKDGDSENFTEK